ncbi:polysaccharide deacetylase family protein [Colwellia sp. D2M02]|uniref:polysaccharide deacetylase family protein n=1 Tax=Colwellia sp. D2M02 TaxID=2841562 RepID=UPI001C09593B|nr:polysaccharide deacetylase family protein [Colwellia sp. D2M02]MBU2892035.1 polysaccharide deacetylase family protein [Colwellia sp. D2M02]
MTRCILTLFLLFFHLSSFAAVILQYHHVSDETPKSTSITPAQFEKHLQFLKDNHFKVVALSTLVEAIKAEQPLEDKLVAITFDDAYSNIATNAKPLLDKFNFPYTIFVNPAVINRNETNPASNSLSWAQLKTLADEGVIIANHGYEHHSLARIPTSETEQLTQQQWLTQQGTLLVKAEAIIKEKTGQSWHYFAYPYGEYDVATQKWLRELGYVGFSQQSGAVGLASDLSSLSRFPVSMPYDKISSLRDKLGSLPLALGLKGENANTIYKYGEPKSITFNVENDDFYKAGLNCYISGLGKQDITWHDDSSFSITFSKDLPVGRVRGNCTAASISEPGRYYWYSKPWFILNEDGSWYPL